MGINFKLNIIRNTRKSLIGAKQYIIKKKGDPIIATIAIITITSIIIAIITTTTIMLIIIITLIK